MIQGFRENRNKTCEIYTVLSSSDVIFPVPDPAPESDFGHLKKIPTPLRLEPDPDPLVDLVPVLDEMYFKGKLKSFIGATI